MGHIGLVEENGNRVDKDDGGDLMGKIRGLQEMRDDNRSISMEHNGKLESHMEREYSRMRHQDKLFKSVLT